MDQDIIARLGGPTAVGRIFGISKVSVSLWRERGIPSRRCPELERASNGSVTVEEMRPDIKWVRVHDKAWPHPSGRPLLDVPITVKEG